MHHLTDRIAHTTDFVISVVEVFNVNQKLVSNHIRF